MSRFEATQLELEGLFLMKPTRFLDERGFFERLFCAQELSEFGWVKNISQINHSFTKQKGTIRGLHFQMPPYAEMKLIQCIRGEIFDVVVDLRASSPTFLKSHCEILSSQDGASLIIPEGFAHGFQALTDEVELIYFHSEPYVANSESGIHVNDPSLAINWPLPITNISTRDAEHPSLGIDFKGLDI